MKCKSCKRDLDDTTTGDLWGNPNICWTCAQARANANGCTHYDSICKCAVETPIEDQLRALLEEARDELYESGSADLLRRIDELLYPTGCQEGA
jgi:hypothetical protein